MTTPGRDEMNAAMMQIAMLRKAAIETQAQRRRKWALRTLRLAIVMLIVALVLAAFALGLVLMSGVN